MQAMMEFQKKGKVEKQIINTRHILFIVSGAFTGLDEIINKRMDKKSIGFKSDGKSTIDNDTILHHATTQDFIDFGFEPEFVGRLPVRVACDLLGHKDLFKVLKNSEGSIINQYIAAFKAYGIEISFTDEALVEISKLAETEKTGARALMTVCEKILRDYKFELPSTGITELVVTGELVNCPEIELKRLLALPHSKKYKKLIQQAEKFESDFDAKHGMSIEFSKSAKELISSLSVESGSSVEDFLDSTLHSYEHGLKLIYQNTGKEHFVLDDDVIENPKLALELMIKASYDADKETPANLDELNETKH